LHFHFVESAIYFRADPYLLALPSSFYSDAPRRLFLLATTRHKTGTKTARPIIHTPYCAHAFSSHQYGQATHADKKILRPTGSSFSVSNLQGSHNQSLTSSFHEILVHKCAQTSTPRPQHVHRCPQNQAERSTKSYGNATERPQSAPISTGMLFQLNFRFFIFYSALFILH
jgi:hypothetical protein